MKTFSTRIGNLIQAKVLNPLKPLDKSLTAEQQMKIFHANVTILVSVLSCILFNIGFFLFSPAISCQLFVMFILSFVLILAAMYHEPQRAKYADVLISFHILFYGPFLLSYLENCIGFFVVMFSMLSSFTLTVFSKRRLSHVLFVAEMLKLYFHFRPRMQKVLSSLTPDQIYESVDNEVYALIPTFVLLHVVVVGIHAKTIANEKAISKINQELRESQETLNVRENFILSLSHEIRNPLNSILGNIELAYDDAIDPSLKQKLFNAKVCGELLLSLVNNVLDVGKADVGNIEICYTECQVLPFIKKIWLTFKQIIKSKGLEPKLEIVTALPRSLAIDQHRLTQILFNLISNALKFTEKGEIRLKISWQLDKHAQTLDVEESFAYIPTEGEDLPSNRTLGCGFLNDHSEKLPHSFMANMIESEINYIPVLDNTKPGVLVVEVIDSGVGIKQASLHHLFDKFVQVSNQERNRLGTGLGLWITKSICEKMNGEISVTSRLGHGTNFTVRIPCNPKSKKLSKLHSLSLPMIQNTGFQGTTAMIVEDSLFNAEIISSYFSFYKIPVVYMAPDGLKAVQFYKEALKRGGQPKIITMDIEMPVMDGITATREIRKLEKKYGVEVPATIIIISANCTEAQISACIDGTSDVGADYFLRKPVKRNDLEPYLKQFIEPSLNLDTNDSILVVDDDLFNLQLMQQMLSKARYQTISSHNGEEAVAEYIKNHSKIKLIFMDCEMIVMNGFQATESIISYAKANNLNPPIIYGLTGHTQKEFMIKCKEVGMKEMIVKPVSYQDIVRLISDAE